ncbi:MAG: HU family DNA-binding protein [Bacteroidales bacterium]|nr:HU family DNA-binding protein [Bacteroidales bacterium]
MLEYYITERNFKQIGDSEVKTKYFAVLDEKTLLDTEELCQRVADCSTLAKPEMRLALDMLVEMTFEALKGGRSVRLGELGILHPTMTSAVQENKEDVTVETIKKISCNFRQSKRLRKALNNEHIRKANIPTKNF